MTCGYKKAFVLIGTTLIASPLSLLSYYGNLLPYLASYYYARQDEISIPVDTLWPASLFKCTFTLAMIFTSPLELRFGIHLCIVAGLILLWASVMCCYIAVQEPLALLLLYGGTHGTAVGIVYPTTLKLLLQTFQNKAGLASGSLAIGPILGALLNIGIAFALINPTNEKPDLYVDNKIFFSDQTLIQRVPNYFLVAGACIVGYTCIGMVLAFIGSSNSAPETDSEILDKPAPSNAKLCEQDTEAEKVADVENETEHLNFSNAEASKNRSVSSSETKKINSEARTYNTVSTLQNWEKALSRQKSWEKSIQWKDNTLKLVQADLSPREVLSTGKFWCVWLCYLCASHTSYLHMNLYKQYGQLAIPDDSVLVTTGMISMLFTLVGRPCVGMCSDKIGIRNTTIAICLCASLFMTFMVISLHRSSWVYVVLVVIEFLSVSPQTMIFSLLATLEFGKTHCASNIGLVTSGNMVILLLEPFFANALIKSVGWDWLFLTGSASSAVSLVAIMIVECLWQKKAPS